MTPKTIFTFNEGWFLEWGYFSRQVCLPLLKESLFCRGCFSVRMTLSSFRPGHVCPLWAPLSVRPSVYVCVSARLGRRVRATLLHCRHPSERKTKVLLLCGILRFSCLSVFCVVFVLHHRCGPAEERTRVTMIMLPPRVKVSTILDIWKWLK